MIASAKESIVLTTFDFRTDESGMDVMAALYDAAERGVKIKLLIDGIYQPFYLRNNESFDSFCTHENIEVKIYNPITLRNIYHVNYRMHDKYIMIDDRMYLLGGRNTTDTFLGDLHAGSNIDREVLVYNAGNEKGESFQELENYFLQIWKGKCVQAVHPSVKEEVIEAEYMKLRERYQSLLKKYGEFTQYDAWYDSTFETNKITLISNETYAGNKEPRVLHTIEHLASEADEVIIQTPYVICNEYMYSVLQKTGKKAKLNILINAVEKGSNPWGCADYLNNKSKILSMGADVYEVMNEYAVHTKTVLINDNISIIGSYNLDMRSTYLDTELMLVIDSEQLNALLRDKIVEYKEKSIEVLSDGTEIKKPLYQEQELPDKKKKLYNILKFITKPFRHLL
ncbi:MAG: phosphatidylserine/phosphatidylglycerophosphate/cardiolipin synthase family protein [Muricoprocola sp.]